MDELGLERVDLRAGVVPQGIGQPGSGLSQLAEQVYLTRKCASVVIQDPRWPTSPSCSALSPRKSSSHSNNPAWSAMKCNVVFTLFLLRCGWII